MRKVVYESDVIEGLEFTSEAKQKEFDRLVTSKEELNNFMVEHNLALIEDHSCNDELVYTNFEAGKLVVRVRSPEQLKDDNIILLEFGDDEFYFYFSDVEDEIILDSCETWEEDIDRILNSYIDEDYICKRVCEELKSKLVLG